jgi:hypothetical protein
MSMIFTIRYRRGTLAALLLAALVAILGVGQASSIHAQTPPRTGAVLTLAAGQTSARTTIQTPSGPAEIVLQGSPVKQTVTAAGTVYSRQCYTWVAGALNVWRMTLYSTFFWDYTTVWQNPPWVSTNSVFPYSWSDISAWNSRWSSTVVFADGQAILHDNVPYPNFLNVTHHLWIQEDAWGNCTFGGS